MKKLLVLIIFTIALSMGLSVSAQTDNVFDVVPQDLGGHHN